MTWADERAQDVWTASAHIAFIWRLWLQRTAWVESAVRTYITLNANIYFIPTLLLVLFFLRFICIPDSVNKFKSSRVLFSLMHFRSEWPPSLNVRVSGVPIAFYCWKGGMHHRRKCSKHIQPNFSKCQALCKHIIFFSERKRQGLSIFVPGLRDFRWVLKATHSCGQITVISGLCVAVRAKWHMMFLQASVLLTVAVYREQFCYHLLTLLSFQSHMIFFPSVKHKSRCLTECQVSSYSLNNIHKLIIIIVFKY